MAARAILFSFDVRRGQMRKPSIALSGLSAHDKRVGYNQSFSLYLSIPKRVRPPIRKEKKKLNKHEAVLLIVCKLEFLV